MSDAFITRRGGGAALNFKIVGGLTRPEKARENTIWVETDQKITEWVIGEERPSNAAEGFLHIKMANSGDMTFNALVKNGIVIGISASYQYIGGAWVEKNMALYAGGNWIENGLPSEYQQVQYLQSSGSQYIDTEYIQNAKTEYETEYAWASLTNFAYAFGTYGSTIFGAQLSGSSAVYYTNSKNAVLTHGASAGTMYKASYKGGVLSASGKSVSASCVQVRSDLNMYLFALSENGHAANYASVRFYSFKIYEDGVLVRDFIPCYRKADSVAGMYDAVRRKFHTNKGSGVFALGGNVEK